MPNLKCKIIEVLPADRKAIQQFLGLPFILYRSSRQWVPPLAKDARFVFDRAHNPFYQHGDAAFYLALDQNSEPLGRIAVLKNDLYNGFSKQETGFFYLFECIDNLDIARALFERAGDWAQQQGLTRLEGPRGFSALDGLGLLARGYEHRPVFGMAYNPEYYLKLIEANGYSSLGESESGYLSGDSRLPEKIRIAAEQVKQRRGFRVIRFKNRRELANSLHYLLEMYNGSLGNTVGTYPLTEADIKALANQMLWFANPSLIKIILKNDQPAGFLLAYPDISAALQRTRGNLFPLGWADLLLEIRRTQWVNVNGAGILEPYRGLGATALLYYEMYKSIREAGYQHAEIVQIGVENEKMRLEMRSFGIEFYKAHRMYGRNL